MSVAINLDKLLVVRLTQAERDAITPVNGMLIYNTTVELFEGYEDGVWTENFAFDLQHGDLIGLLDDDHTQYVLRQPTADTVINESGGDFDFRIEGDNEPFLLDINAENDIVGIGGIAINDVQLAVEDDTDDDAREVLRLLSTRATRVDDDEIFMGWYQPNSVGAQVEFSRITSVAVEVASGSEGGRLDFDVVCAGSGGTPAEFLRFTGVAAQAESIFNFGNQDIDFRVRGTTENSLLFIDASQNIIGIGGDPIAGVQLTVETDTNETASELLRLKSVRSSRADDDSIFMSWYQANAVGGQAEFGRITNYARDVTQNMKASGWEISGFQNDVTRRIWIWDATAGVNFSKHIFNPDDVDMDFEVRGDNEAQLLICDAGLDTVGIGGIALADVQLVIENDTDGASLELLRLKSVRATRSNLDEVFIGFYQPNSAGQQFEYTRLSSIASNVTQGNEAGVFQFEVSNASGLVEGLRVDGNFLSVIVNDAGADFDFRCEGSSETHLLVADAGRNVVSIGGPPQTNQGQLQVEVDTDEVSSEMLRLRSVRATRADNDEIHISFFQPDAGGVQTESHRIISEMADVSSGTEKTIFRIQGNVNGVLTGLLNLGKLANGTNRFGIHGTEASIQIVTQDFSTEDSTHANRTAAVLTDNSGGAADTTIAVITNAANVGSADVGPTADAIADLAAQVNALRVDQQDTAAFLNFIVASLTDHGMFELAGGG